MIGTKGIEEFTPKFFDESSAAWMANKVRVGAMMVYRCSYALSYSRQCSKASVDGSYCKAHSTQRKPQKGGQLFL